MIKIIFLLVFISACQGAEFSEIEKRDSSLKELSLNQVIVCSQNLARLGERKKDKQQLNYLVQRMLKTNCDVIALQEIVRSNPRALAELTKLLSKKSGRKYLSYQGESRDKHITNGFLVAEELGQVVKIKSYWNKSLPRMYPLRPPRTFLRGPLALHLELAPSYWLGEVDQGQSTRHGASIIKKLIIYSIHFKSKHDGWKDPAKMNFELERIESAQAVRDLALAEDTKEAALLIIGDRNNGKDQASDEVLEGRIELSDLSKNCKLTKDEKAICNGQLRAPKLIGLFGLRLEQFPNKYPLGSHKFRGKENLLDEAFIRPQDLGLVSKGDKSLSIGYSGDYFKGSDHKLLYVILGQGHVD